MRQALLALALAMAAVAAPAPAPAPETMKIPFERRSVTNADGTVNMENLLISLSKTLVKYKHEPLPDHLLKRASSNVPLTDQVVGGTEDEDYYGPSKIGSQSFTLDFDTGSADLFVPGPSCGTAQGCTHPTKYKNTGQDQHNMTEVTYGSGMVIGENYKDKVSVGGLTVPHQGFVSLTNAMGFGGLASDGLMGMGFSTIANSGFPTFVENLIAQHSLTTPEFSFYLGRAVSGTQRKSELTLGGRDASRYSGTTKSVPVTKKGYWQVKLDNVFVNGKSAGATTAGQAAIDTGTTVVLGPTAAVSAVFANIPGAVPLPGLSGSPIITLFGYPCNTSAKYIPKITFGGTHFAINPKDFNLGTISSSTGLIPRQNPGGLCVAGLGGADLDPTENLYVVGDVFLKNWYSTYNYNGPAVSFAPATGNQ